MRVLLCGDVHWSTYSSILRSRGEYFSTRLEYLIKSLNWVEKMADEYSCDEEIFLGDFFDKPELNAEEITALSEVEWSKKPRLRHFLVGNHESGMTSLEYNSTQVLYNLGAVEDVPYIYPLDDKTEFLFLPYITEDSRKPLNEYLKNRSPNKKMIILSHNDIKDYRMGMFISKTGFSIQDIEDNCDLYINGHLHNGGWVSPRKILNLGNLTGQNFSEDAFKYGHHIGILDTDTLEIEFIENPYAMNFYKLEMNERANIGQLEFLKENAVVSIKCEESLKDTLEKELRNVKLLCSKISYYVKADDFTLEDAIEQLQTVDHLEKFKLFVLEKLGKSEVVLSELQEVCK